MGDWWPLVRCQFVPVAGSKNSFRFEKQSDGTWQAVIEAPGSATATVYKMERFPAK